MKKFSLEIVSVFLLVSVLVSSMSVFTSTAATSVKPPQKTPNDPYYENQREIFESIQLPQAWAVTTGSKDIKVGVIDTGLTMDKNEFTEVNVDIELSKKFKNNFIDVGDYYGNVKKHVHHGTSVSSVIGSKGNNGYGVTGVCWDTSIVILKDKDGYDAESAIEYADKNDIKILNFSKGRIVDDNSFKKAIQNYSGLMICAAGNDGLNLDEVNNSNNKYATYPVMYNMDNIISVAAVDSNGNLKEYSNYGEKYVDVAAPTDVYAVNNTNTSKKLRELSQEDYATFTGTSCAAPVVTGIAALVKSVHPELSPAGIKQVILDNVDKDKSNSLKDKVKSGGIVNAYKSVILANSKTYTVKYNANGGSGSMNNTTVVYGAKEKLSANKFSRTGYTFSGWTAYRAKQNQWFYKKGSETGWFQEGKQPSGYTKYIYKDKQGISKQTSTKGDTVTMYAQWTPIKYTVIYDKNASDATGAMKEMTVTYGVGQGLTKNALKRTGYKFTGWTAYRASDKKWFCVKKTDTSKTGWYTTVPSDYKKYVYKDQQGVAKQTAVNGDKVTLYAQWTPNKYTVKYDKNASDAKSTMKNMTVSYGVAQSLTKDAYTRTGYKFSGWTAYRKYDNKWFYSNADGTKTGWFVKGTQDKKIYTKLYVYKDQQGVAKQTSKDGDTVTMYAQWKKQS